MYKSVFGRLGAIAALLLTLMTGCAPTQSLIVPTIQSPPAYDELFPYYVEACAVSQIRPLKAPDGGSVGHAVVYLKGVCSDTDAAYPRIEMCDPRAVDLKDSESGVGISVNKFFKSINWIAVPGKRLFYHGNLDAGELLTKELYWETVREALRLGVFRGVEFHEKYMQNKPRDMSAQDFIASESLGTDYAMKFGRSIFCTRLPVTASMMEDVIAFLNDLNREYAEGEAHYDWSGYHDNCSHTVRNSLANADVWEKKPIRVIKLRQMFHMAIPANEFINLAFLSTDFPVEDFSRVYDDTIKRRSLLERNWLPTRHGALLQTIGVHLENELYDPKLRILVLEEPLLKPKRKRIRSMLGQDRYTDLEANLLWWKDRYDSILANRPEDLQAKSWTKLYKEAASRYYEYIEVQRADVAQKLDSLHHSSP